jgi:chlorobactene glucosyltransferase
MILLACSIVWVLVVAGLLARAVTQYRHYKIIAPVALSQRSAAPGVTVIVPARNEERIIGRCLDGLTRQDYTRDQLQFLVVDDSSTDRTAAIIAESAARDDRIRPIRGQPLPEGWLGKPHACWTAAKDAKGEWLCFIDADTVADPPLIGTAIETALSRRLDLVSLQPFQELGTFAERLILPTGFFLIAFTQDLRKTNDPALPDASVNGQFLLIRRSVYSAVGGHATVKDATAEDSALARAIKSAGHSVGVFGTQGLLHTRMYGDSRSLVEGAARQAATLLGGAPALLSVALGAMLLAFVPIALPVLAACRLAGVAGGLAIISLVLSGAGSLSLFGTHIGAARYFRIPFWYGLVFPLGYLGGAGVLVFAAWQQSRGQTRWKGRVYSVAAPASPDSVPRDSNEAAPT